MFFEMILYTLTSQKSTIVKKKKNQTEKQTLDSEN